MIKITVKVEGMMCPRCEAHAKEAISEAMSTKSISASHERSEVVIIAKEYNEDTIREAIAKAGYKAFEITNEPYKSTCFLSKIFKK